MRIGVFDSGVGGEAVAARLRELLPGAEVLTARDRAHVPYGSRPPEEVRRLTSAAIRPLLEASCETIVLACNTATAVAIDGLRAEHPELPFVGLEPMVKPAAALTRSRSVVVCATPATLASERYRALKERWASGVAVAEPDCARWAGLIERGEASAVDLGPLVALVAESAADVVVLACTHYHWLKEDISRALGPRVSVLEPSDAIAAQITRILGAARPGPR